ncbi:MAG TPA: hypothetical protein VJV03_10565 [Pyrinomonadaceae bacterium]|nr:hypothetical protein [Pyrinomonadaceae bacterium]
MPDPVARKRLKKRMLDRWENEGGSIAAETTSDDAISAANKTKAGKKKSPAGPNSTAQAPASTGKNRKPTRK